MPLPRWFPRARRGVAALGVAAVGALGALAVCPRSLVAADHIDFPGEMLGAQIEGAADISDVHAWVPRAGRLVLVMNVNPFATDASRFSDALDYQFRLRTATLERQGDVSVPRLTEDEEVAVVCRVIDEVVTCTSPIGRASAPVGEVTGSDKAAMRVFAGLRAEAFYLDGEGIKKTVGSQFTPTPALHVPTTNPVNFSDAANTLSLVVELDAEKLFGTAEPLVAVIGETARRVQP